ncbi:MAG: MATE family efflux transporter [Ilumatobacteraceae bacterium]
MGSSPAEATPSSLSRQHVDRRLFRLALPALGTLAVEPLYVATDTAIIGRVGAEELAGLAAAGTILALIVAGTNFLAYGTTERIASARGAQNEARSGAFAQHALLLGVIIGMLACAALVPLASSIVSLLGAGPEATSHGIRYLTIAAFGLPAVVVMVAAQGVLRGHADYRRPFVVLMASNILNAVIEIPLVFWADLSITGSAVSTVIAQYVGAIWLVIIAKPHLQLGRRFSVQSAIVRDLLRVGSDLGVRVFSMLAIFTASTVLAARSGDAVLAAHQIVNGTFLLLALCLDAISIPAHTLLGESRGSGHLELQRRVSSRVYFWSGVLGVALAIIIFASANVLPHLFTADESVKLAATDGLRFLAIALIPGAIAFGGDGVLIGLSDSRFLGVAAFAHTAIMALALFSESIRTGPGLSRIWALLALWMVIRALTVTARSRVLLR